MCSHHLLSMGDYLKNMVKKMQIRSFSYGRVPH